MAPKKKEVQKLSLGEFMNNDAYGGSWADEVEDTVASGTQPLPPSERRGYGGGGGASSYGGEHRGYSSIRDNLPQKLPEKPPYTAHLGNLSYDATTETVTDFFQDCNPVNIRIIEDREQQRPKGFAYAEFADLEGLKTALTYDGSSFQGRNIRIKIADPPKERYGGGVDSSRDLSDWTRKGPLADLPSSRPDRRGGDFGDRPDRRPPREPQGDDGKVRDFGNWERRGPLSPLPQADRPPPSRDGSRAPLMDRSESRRGQGNRRESPAWGPGEGRQDSRPRREFTERPERPERVPTAAEKEVNWRNNMRPDAAGPTPGQSREGSEAPPSPVPAAPQQPAGRPRLNLAKRTVSETPGDLLSPSSTTDSKASPFGAARPIDTAARERELEEKRAQAAKEKKEAEEKAKEERRLAKEAQAAKEAAEKAAAEAAAEEKAKQAAEQAVEQPTETTNQAAGTPQQHDETINDNGAEGERKVPVRSKEPRGDRPHTKQQEQPSRATESINWRQPSGEQRPNSRGGHIPSGPRRGGGPPRGPRNEGGRPPRTNGNGPAPLVQQTSSSQGSGADQSPSTPVADEDGWTMVPNKNRRGQSSRPLVS